MHDLGLHQSIVRMGRSTSSRPHLIIAVGFLVMHLSTSLYCGSYGALPRNKHFSARQSRLSVIAQGGQFTLNEYVESNFFRRTSGSIDEGSAKVVNSYFISTASALQSYTGNN